MTATIFEAKAKFSELVKRAQAGEEVIITSGREKTPVAVIKAVQPVQRQRFGFLLDSNIDVPNSFFFDSVPEEWTGAVDDPDDPLNWSDDRIAAANRESEKKWREEAAQGNSSK